MEGIRVPDAVKYVTLSLDTNAYATDDLLADTQAISGVFPEGDSEAEAILYSLTLWDRNDNGRALDLIFATSGTSMGTENNAFAASTAAGRDVVSVVQITAGDYYDLIGSQVVTKNAADSGMGILVRGKNADETDLYVSAVYRDGTGDTYTAGGLQLKIGFLRG